jgi:hypothetical protein
MSVCSQNLPKEDNSQPLTYIDYDKNPNCIKSYKLPELKRLAKNYKLHVSGTKSILYNRIENFFKRCLYVLKIQRFLRGYFVRFSNRLRGKGFRERKNCVNDSDFYTLEPLLNIDYDDFYSYQDAKDFVYGFSIESLVMLQKQKGSIMNPYNRELFTKENMNQLRTLCRLNAIIGKYENKWPINNPKTIPPPRRPQTILYNRVLNIENQFVETRTLDQPLHIYSRNTVNGELLRKIIEIQSKPLDTRVRELFMEIDQLGNYTQSSWFNLPLPGYMRLYRYLYDIWQFRAQLSIETQRHICSLGDPFQRLGRLNEIPGSIDQMKSRCLFVMEYMVHTGTDIEYRRLGALHVLSALTLVSLNARNAMRWLYESVAY